MAKLIKYLVTICKPQKKDYVSRNALREIIAHLSYNNIHCTYGKWERHGMYKQLHYHGIFIVPDTIKYSNFTKLANYRVHFEYIKDNLPTIIRVKRYIDKHYNRYTNTQLDTHLANYYNNHYGF